MNYKIGVEQNQEQIGWLTNRETGKAFRPDNDYGYVSERVYKNLPRRFKRHELWEWCERQSEAEKLLLQGGKPRQLLVHYSYEVYFYTLSVKELGGAAFLEDFRRYDDPALIEAWKRLLDRAFIGQPYAWCLHIGNCGRIQAHVISGVHNNIANPGRNPQRKKRIKNSSKDYVRAFAYLCSKASPIPEQVKSFKKAAKKAGGVLNLPKHSGFRGFELIEINKKVVKNFVTGASYENNPQAVGLSKSYLADFKDVLEHPVQTSSHLGQSP